QRIADNDRLPAQVWHCLIKGLRQVGPCQVRGEEDIGPDCRVQIRFGHMTRDSSYSIPDEVADKRLRRARKMSCGVLPRSNLPVGWRLVQGSCIGTDEHGCQRSVDKANIEVTLPYGGIIRAPRVIAQRIRHVLDN